MSRDGGLRTIFRDHIKTAHWQPVETGSIMAGVPDSNYCLPYGMEGWIEFKLSFGKQRLKFEMDTPQRNWGKARRRRGGRWCAGVRRKYQSLDQLWILGVNEIDDQILKEGMLVFEGGPARWPWDSVITALQMSVDEFSFFCSQSKINSSSPSPVGGKPRGVNK